MRLLLLGLLVTAGMIWIAPRSLSQQKAKPASRADTVLAIFTEPGMVAKPEPKLIFIATEDGRVYWSIHRIEGGQPYFSGRIDPSKIAAVLKKLERAGIFQDASLRRSYVGPDAGSTVLFIQAGKQRLRMESWHELFETNGNNVATHEGIVSLNGRKREAVLRQEPADYRKFRATWSTIRRLADGLVPATGKHISKLPAEAEDVMGW